MRSHHRATWVPAGDDHLLVTAAVNHDERGLAAWHAVRPRFVLERADDERARLLPLLLQLFAEQGVTDPELPAMIRLRRLGKIRSMLVMWGAGEAIRALSAAGIEAMALKGSVLAVTVFDDPALRPMGDADLLVRPADVPEAAAVLESLGHEGRGLRDRRYVVMRHGLGYTRSDGVAIDLHWMPHRALALPGLSRTFPQLPWEADLPADEWWERARAIEVNGAPVLAPSPTDVLLHVLLHGALGGFGSRLRWVTDAGALLRVEGDAVDWDLLVAQAGRRQVSGTLADALRYLRAGQGLAVPRRVVDALDAAPTGLRVRLADRWSTRPLPTTARLTGDLPNTTVRYLLMTRQDRGIDVVRGAPRFLAAGWGVDPDPRSMARALLAKVRSGTVPRAVKQGGRGPVLP